MTKKKVLVLSPAGRIYEHDRVEWYPEPFSRIKGQYFNIGDMVVHDSTLKLLDFQCVVGMVTERLHEGLLNWYKTFDLIVVRASNFIHNQMDWLYAQTILDQLQLPVYAIGVGAQSSGGGTYQLNDHNLRFWKTVAERSQIIGVRGEFTAELLAANGIKNTEVVGCPTIFRTRNRNLKLSVPKDIRKVAFSVRREADATYTRDIRKYLQVQRDLLLNTASTFDTQVTIHGETEEKAYYYHDLEAMARAESTFMHEGWWTPETRARMDDLYRNRLFFFLKVEDYDEFITTQDFALGYRVHGVLPAMANGVPGFLIKYDSRSGELAKTHCIPSVSLEDGQVDVRRLLESVDFSEFNAAYPLRYDKMRWVLDKNGLPNRM